MDTMDLNLKLLEIKFHVLKVLDSYTAGAITLIGGLTANLDNIYKVLLIVTGIVLLARGVYTWRTSVYEHKIKKIEFLQKQKEYESANIQPRRRTKG